MSEGTWNAVRPTLSTAVIPRTVAIDESGLPVRLSYTTRRRTKGLALAVAAAGLLLTGLFMLSQITSTPAVAVQLCAVGLLLTGGGLAVLHSAARQSLGALTIDDQGISQSPSFAGFSIPWQALSRWVVRDQPFPGAGLPVVRFWSQGDSMEFTIPADSLGENDLRALRRILRRYAPGQESVA